MTKGQIYCIHQHWMHSAEISKLYIWSLWQSKNRIFISERKKLMNKYIFIVYNIKQEKKKE